VKTEKHIARRTWPESAWSTDYHFPESAVAAGELRGKLKTYGPWQLPVSYTALAVEYTEVDETHFSPYYPTAILHGLRTMSRPRESGYVLEGQVSIDGKKRRAFTSSALFLVGGKLVDVAILYVCSNGGK
jgi:hypothetical protein